MATLAEFRKQYPQYDDVDDQALADGLHKKFYSSLPQEDFYKKIDFTPKPSLLEDAATGVESTGLKVAGAAAKGLGELAYDDSITGRVLKKAGSLLQSEGIKDEPKRWSGQVTSGLAYIPFGEIQPLVAAGAEGSSRTQELESQGVDPDTAARAGLAEGAVTGAAMHAPMGHFVVGEGSKPFIKSAAKAAGKSAAVGAGQEQIGDEAASEVLSGAGYDKQATQYAPTLEKAKDSALFMGAMHLGTQGAMSALGMNGAAKNLKEIGSGEQPTEDPNAVDSIPQPAPNKTPNNNTLGRNGGPQPATLTSNASKFTATHSPSDASFAVSDESGNLIKSGFQSSNQAENEAERLSALASPKVELRSPAAQQVDAAASVADKAPSDAQKEAGNYRKGHVEVHGIPITIENAKGSTREGFEPDGTPWSTEMPDHYGYIKKTNGADGEHIDTYVGPNPESKNVFVVDQVNPETGEFDEHKAMLGYDNETQALSAYRRAFSDGTGDERVGNVTPLEVSEFKTWLKNGDGEKPIADQIPSQSKSLGSAEPVDSHARLLHEDQAVTPTGSTLPIQYALVEANKLITSHDDNLRENLFFPTDLQPRDRTRGDTELQLTRMLSTDKFQPAMLDKTVNTSDGAPVVGEDGVVESGNGRTMAIRRAYDRNMPAADAYRDYLQKQGYPVEGMKQPVLVRINRAGMDPEQRRNFASESNKPSQMVMSSTERALADAAKVTDDLMTLAKPGDILQAQNRGFVRSILKAIASENEMSTLVTPEGGLSQDGLRRVQGAILAKAYGDAGIIQSLTENTDNNFRAIGNALIEAAPMWSKMRAAVATGIIPHDLDVTPHLISAIKIISHARAEGRNVIEYIKQKDIFAGDTVPPETETMLKWLLGEKDFTRRIGQAKIADTAQYYAQEALKAQPGPGLFGEADRVNPMQLAEAAREKVQRNDDEPATDLFKQEVGKPTSAASVRNSDGKSGSEESGQGSSENGQGNAKSGEESTSEINQIDKRTKLPENLFPTKVNSDNISKEKLTDVGEKLGGARKDQWAQRGMTAEDLKNMTGGEQSKYVTKDAVWPKPDYAKLIANGMEPRVAATLKLLRDSLAASPRKQTAEGRQHYVEVMSKMREIYEAIKSPQDFMEARSKLVHDFIGISKDWKIQKDQEKLNKLFSIIKGSREGLQPNSSILFRAKKLVDSGWPSEESSKKVRNKPNSDNLEKLPTRPHLDNLKRLGKDVRSGRNVDGNDLVKDFGFRGIEFGNWAASDERQKSVNLAFDALHDLSNVLNVPPETMSLDGKLGLAFGARGTGKAAAHYEPAKMVINLTKIKGAGTLAHEWGHALDHYLGELDKPDSYSGNARGASGWYERKRYDHTSTRLSNLRPEVADAFNDLMGKLFRQNKERALIVRERENMVETYKNQLEKTKNFLEGAKDNQKTPAWQVKDAQRRLEHLETVLPKYKEALEQARNLKNEVIEPADTSYFKNAKTLSGKSGEMGYWARPTEMFARSFESYVFDKIAAAKNKSEYLVHSVEPDTFTKEKGYKGNPYPVGKERIAINEAFDKLMAALKTREGTSGKQTLYDRPKNASNEVPPEAIRLSKGLSAIPKTAFTANEAKIVATVEKEVQRLLGNRANVKVSDRLFSNGETSVPGEVLGATTSHKFGNDVQHIVHWALSADDAVGVGRHEAIHALKRSGMFDNGEWKILEKAAEKGNWIKNHNVEGRWEDLKNRPAQLEEAIAEEFSKWRRGESNVPAAIRPLFAKIRLLLQRVAAGVRQILGKDATVDDIFSKIETGEIGKRSVSLNELKQADYQRPPKNDASPKEKKDWFLTKPMEAIEHGVGEFISKKAPFFDRLGEGYMKVIAPETVSHISELADARVAQMKVRLQNAYDAIAKHSKAEIERWDKVSKEEKQQWIRAHETGEYDPNDPAHQRFKALTDATWKAEREALNIDPTQGYRENYFTHLFEKPDKVKAYFEKMISKHGQDWFNKKRSFELADEAEKAGFPLRTHNPEEMLQMRLMAGQDMIENHRLLETLVRDGWAVKTKDLGKPSKTDPKQNEMGFIHASKMPDGQLKELIGNSFPVRGPDGKEWRIHNDVAPLWKNAMDSRGLWENQGAGGDLYRGWQAWRAFQIPLKLAFSLFHPIHVATIHVGHALATTAESIYKGGFDKEAGGDAIKSLKMALTQGLGLSDGIGVRGGKLRDHPYIEALKTLPDNRTPDQKMIVNRFEEGGFTPLMSAKDEIHYARQFKNALANKKYLSVIPRAAQGVVRAMSSPFFEHWIPALKAECYMRRTETALSRDPSLRDNDAERATVFRQISKDIERTYGEMNYDTLFWNKTVRDAFNASFLSSGWKLAQLYYAKGLLRTPKMLYNAIKTGEINPGKLTYNSTFALAYGGLSMVAARLFMAGMGAAYTGVRDLVAPPTGEKMPDGTPVRASLPFFNKEFYALKSNMDQHGLIGGLANFVYEQSMIPDLVGMATATDRYGRELVSDWTSRAQIAHAAWNTITPISTDLYQRAAMKKSEMLKLASFFGVSPAPNYMNQSTFENKLIGQYFKDYPSKTSVYQRDTQNDYRVALAESNKLQEDLETAKAKGDVRAVEKLTQKTKDMGYNDNGESADMQAAKDKLRKLGVSAKEIGGMQKQYTTPFSQYAWKKLPAESQISLFDSATNEEKKIFYPLMHAEAKQQVKYKP